MKVPSTVTISESGCVIERKKTYHARIRRWSGWMIGCFAFAFVINVLIAWGSILRTDTFTPTNVVAGYDYSSDTGWDARRASGNGVMWVSSSRGCYVGELIGPNAGGIPPNEVLPAWTGFRRDSEIRREDSERVAFGSGWPVVSMWYEARLTGESPKILGGVPLGHWQQDFLTSYYEEPVPRAIPLRLAPWGTAVNTIVIGFAILMVFLIARCFVIHSRCPP
jgi:hypothetical protein